MTIKDDTPIRIVLADDHVLFSDCLRDALNKQRDMVVVAEVADGLEAVKMAKKLKPDLIVMDVSMPGMNGVEATRQIRANRSDVKVLCLSMHSDESFVAEMLDAGATGYALKDTPMDVMTQAVRVVMSGETFLSPAVASAVVAGYSAGHDGKASAFSTLTNREREVLQLLAEGHSAKAIAIRLQLSVKTVGTHREHLMDKLGIHDVAGLTKYAIRKGLTSSDAN